MEQLALAVARLVVALTQDRRGVRGGGDERRQLGLDRHAAVVAELELRAEQGLARGRPEQQKDLGLDLPELLPQPRVARVDLEALRRGVHAPLAALLELEVLDRVGDVDVGAVDPNGLEAAVELAPGGPDERPPLPVLAIARLLADHHDAGLLQALAEDGLRRVAPEVAAAAARRCFPEVVEIAPLRAERRRVAWLLRPSL